MLLVKWDGMGLGGVGGIPYQALWHNLLQVNFSQCRSTGIGVTGGAGYKTEASAYNYWGVSSLFIPLLSYSETSSIIDIWREFVLLLMLFFLRVEGF